mmetsp:Transcript_14800/g.41659  ORF Transcript_14800/g.41659 Transcript_14800/m.41659 type:complete len:315 (+) Transcript_14800:1776-2720(+)
MSQLLLLAELSLWIDICLCIAASAALCCCWTGGGVGRTPSPSQGQSSSGSAKRSWRVSHSTAPSAARERRSGQKMASMRWGRRRGDMSTVRCTTGMASRGMLAARPKCSFPMEVSAIRRISESTVTRSGLNVTHTSEWPAGGRLKRPWTPHALSSKPLTLHIRRDSVPEDFVMGVSHMLWTLMGMLPVLMATNCLCTVRGQWRSKPCRGTTRSASSRRKPRASSPITILTVPSRSGGSNMKSRVPLPPFPWSSSSSTVVRLFRTRSTALAGSRCVTGANSTGPKVTVAPGGTVPERTAPGGSRKGMRTPPAGVR